MSESKTRAGQQCGEGVRVCVSKCEVKPPSLGSQQKQLCGECVCVSDNKKREGIREGNNSPSLLFLLSLPSLPFVFSDSPSTSETVAHGAHCHIWRFEGWKAMG